MPVEVHPNTPLADAIISSVQPKLLDVGWGTGGQDDAALAEYIVLMLVNGKTEEEIASDISGELLNLGPDDPVAKEFASWLFQEVEAINNRLNSVPEPQQGATEAMQISGEDQSTAKPGGDPVISAYVLYPGPHRFERNRKLTLHNSPTGPRSMRNPGNMRGGRDKRMFGQMTKAMDRSQDVLHRVRGHTGNERINTHNRAPPSGPRGNMMRQQRNANGRAANIQAGLMGNMGGAAPGAIPGMPGPNGMSWGMMTEQPSSAELMNLLQQQSQMMQQISSQMMAQSNGGFRGGRHRGRGRGGHQHRGQTHDQSQAKDSTGDGSEDVDMGGAKTEPTNPEDHICKFNLKCNNKDCKFVHQSPAAPPGVTIDLQDVCSFGAACKNWKCVGRHPSPAARLAHQSEQDCKFFPNCQNPRCPFRHPSMPLCRNGANCTTPNCKFTHVKTKCKFTPCLNPSCPFLHEEGQQGGFKDKVWTANSEKEHVSERKFVNENEETEMVVAEGADGAQEEAEAIS